MSIKLLILSLVLLLSLGTASAILSVNSISGSTGFSGYRMANDTVIMNVTSTSNVSTNGNNCTESQSDSSTYVCVFNDIASNPDVIYQLSNSEGETTVADVFVDNGIGNINYNITSINGVVTLNYLLQDTGFNGNPSCSGLNTLNIFDGVNNINVIDINGTPGVCSYSGQTNLSITSSGNKAITLTAMDNVGNKVSTQPQNITFDISPPQISNNLEVKETGTNNILSAISSTNVFYVDMYFTVNENNLSKVQADISSITNNPAIQYAFKNVNVPLTSCIFNATSNDNYCVIRNVPLKLNGASSLSITITATDANGNIGTGTATKTFTIDNVVPQVSITTDHCDVDGKCFVKNGDNNFILKFNKQNFDKRYVYFSVPGSMFGTYRVQNCTQGICTADVSLTCADGPISVSILNPQSVDDSGNTLADYSTNIYCDNIPPVVDNAELSGDSSTQLPASVLVSGNRITLTASINETMSNFLTAYAYIADITPISKVQSLINGSEKGTCADNNGNFTCTFSIDTVDDQKPHKINIDMIVNDTAGNSVTYSLPTRTILGLNSANSTPSFFNSQFISIKPSSGVDRVTLDLTQFNNIKYYVFANYKINQANGGSNVRLVYQKLDISDCTYDDGVAPGPASTFFQSAVISNIYANTSEVNRIDLAFRSNNDLNVNQIADSFNLLCNISAYVRQGDNIYVKPQIFTLKIPMTMRNSKLSTPGEEFAKKIEALQSSVQNNDGKKFIESLNKGLGTVQQLCDMKRYVDYAQMSGTLLETAGMATSFFPPISSLLGRTGTAVDSGAGMLGQQIWGQPGVNSLSAGQIAQRDATNTLTKSWGIAGQACAFVSCSLPWNSDVTFGLDDSITTPLNDAGSWLDNSGGSFTQGIGLGNELTTGLKSSDVKNSIVMSAAKLCLPGIVYNLNKYNQIDCEYLQCLKVYSATGLDVGQCDALKSTKTCSLVVGQAFELPFIRVGKNLFSNAADIIRSSYGRAFNLILKTVLSQENCKDGKLPGTKYDDIAVLECRIPYAIQQYISFQKATVKSEDFHYDQTQDFCAVATCVGPSCLTPQSTFGTPLPPLTISGEQRNSLFYRRAFGQAGVDQTLNLLALAAYAPTIDQRQQYLGQYKKEADALNLKMADQHLGDRLPDVSAITSDTPLDDGRGVLYNTIAPINEQLNPSGNPNAALTPSQASFNIAQMNYNNAQKSFTDEYGLLISSRVQGPPPVFADIRPDKISESNFVSQFNKIDALNIKPVETLLNAPGRVFVNYDQLFTAAGQVGIDPNKMYYVYTDDGQLVQIEGFTLDNAVRTSEKDLRDTINSGDPVIKVDPQSGQVSCAEALDCRKIQTQYKIATDAKSKMTAAQYAVHVEDLNRKVDFGVRILFDTLGFKKFLTAEYWTDKWGPGKYITQVSESLDPQNWKNNLCNPNGGAFFSGTAPQAGTVYQCTNTNGQGCNLVLSFGVERADYDYNGTQNLYTLTYILGPVTSDTNFNIVFKSNSLGGAQTIRGWASDKLLTLGNVAQNSKILIMPDKYDQVCFEFEKNFPTASDQTEYCRDIKENVFRTGSPYTPLDVSGVGGTTGAGSTGGATTYSPSQTKGFLEQ